MLSITNLIVSTTKSGTDFELIGNHNEKATSQYMKRLEVCGGVMFISEVVQKKNAEVVERLSTGYRS